MHLGRIILDVSPSSIVVACRTCPSWAELASSHAEARRIAIDHETHAHPGDYRARRAAHMADTRRAEPQSRRA